MINIELNDDYKKFIQEKAPLTKVTGEVLLNILTYFPVKEICAFQRVSKQFYIITSGPDFWKYLNIRDFPDCSDIKDPLKQYQNFYKIEQNWLKWQCKNSSLETSCLYQPSFKISEDKLICEGKDNSIQIFNKNTRKLELTLNGHPGYDDLSSEDINVIGKRLITYASCGLGGEVKLWNLDDGSCICKINSTVHSVFNNTKLYVHSYYDSVIDVYNLFNGSKTYTIAQTEEISSTLIYEKFLLIGYYNGSINIFDNVNGSLIQTLQCDEDGAVTKLHYDKNYIISEHRKGKIKLWDRKKYFLINTLKACDRVSVNNDFIFSQNKNIGLLTVWEKNKQEVVCELEGVNLYAVCSKKIVIFNKGIFKIINVRDGSTCKSWEIEDNEIYGLDIFKGRLFTSSRKKEIQVWDIERGKLLSKFQGRDPFVSEDRVYYTNNSTVEVLDFN